MFSNKCEINEIILKDKHNCPIITHFQNSMNCEEENINWQLAENKEKKSKLLIASTSSNLYYGTVGEGSTDLVTTFVAVRNKTTNKIKLIEVEETTMINSVYDQNDPSILMKNTKNFSMSLSGKKYQLKVDKLEKAKMNIDVVKDQLDMTVQSVNTPEFNESMESEGLASLLKIIPKRNMFALKVKDIYKLEDVIPEKVLNQLNKLATSVLTVTTEDLDVKYNIVKKIIIKVLTSKDRDTEENINIIKACLYMDSLMNLIKNPLTTNNQISEIKQIDVDLKTRFFLSNHRQKTQYTKQKAITHLLVLLLLSSEKFEFDIGQLIEDIHIKKADLMLYANSIGAYSVHGTNVIALSLRKIKTVPTFQKKRK